MAQATGATAALSRTVTIVNQRGLHARAAAKFVRLATQYDAAVTVCNADNEVSALSIMGLMMLAASPGTQITLRASGRQAEEALTALEDLICSRFGEGE
ncbi:MAG: HPr family phosphocarrier protein [Reyranellaceae bacterium]